MKDTIKHITFVILFYLIFISSQSTTLAQIPPEELASAIWIIRQYGSTLGQDATSICSPTSRAFTCANGHITRVEFTGGYASFSASGSGVPDPTLNVINFPECTEFILYPGNPNPNYIGDPNQNILDKLTNIKKITTFSIISNEIKSIPNGFLRNFPQLTTLILSLPNVTTIQESSFEVSSATIVSVNLNFATLKTYTSPTNTSASLMWRSLGQLVWTVYPATADGPISLVFSKTVFPDLHTLVLDSTSPGTISVSASFQNLYVIGTLTSSFSLTVPNPLVVQNLRLNGLSTVSPPLHTFPALLTKYDSALTTLPTFPLPTSSFTHWQYGFLTENTTIPWEALTPDNKPRLLDISNNIRLGGSVPDSFCVNKLIISGTNISSVPDCYWCYRTDPTSFLTTLPVPPGFTCPLRVDQANQTLYTKEYRANLTGHLIGWGNNVYHPATLGYYILTPVVPQKILLLYYVTNGTQTNTTIKLNEYSPHTVNLTILEVGITLSKVNVTLLPNQKLLFTWLFSFYNNLLVHQFQSTFGLTGPCNINSTKYTTGPIQATITCLMDFNPFYTGRSFVMEVSNPHNKETYTIPFNYYPRLFSGQIDSNNQRLIYLFGDFRQNHSLANITINDKIACTINASTIDSINCTLSENASYGPANVSITVDGYLYLANDFLYFTAPPNNNGSTTTGGTTTGGGSTPQSQCQESTSNCFGHGSCDINGQCQCDNGYNPIDNCLTKFTNSTPVTNTTTPTSSFEIDGTRFDFELVAIQEIDTDENVVGELLTNSWNATINSDNSTTLVTYQLVNISDPLYIATMVQAMISFSTQPRDIQFGDQLLHINPNSIKLALNITNWQYSNLISTLRVVFRTDVNMDQTVEFGCKQQSISTFPYDQFSSTIQYLKEIKDNVQYNGRFIDYVLSNGKPTFSKTTLINQTAIQSSSSSSIMSTLIGVSLPQCQECLLDPDFTPLLIDNDTTVSDCESNSKTWKIIVGVVVGGFAAIAIAVGTVMLIKKKKLTYKQNKKMENRLKNMS
ncbi:hypothetical protein DFA_03245 [Cavenderia fasciculata]|uniref:EGF-like domain-containing protein n=1 Tax=Cavenderia fasciculata TaxID=261658 RepID=F4PH15_CACFS|nr:uncharacterized protein DFA_03245 [Cavenderia fasciculata]EGG24999.1 hypothetical protein DFA_03245 [Cavenderia fasciculata]|eukprot:XP_004362850.1 hypothetical protein DFA_03245 [Cavenderia fasciculata]